VNTLKTILGLLHQSTLCITLIVHATLTCSCGLVSSQREEQHDEIAYVVGSAIMVYDMQTKDHRKILDGHGPLRWSPDGKLIAFSRVDGMCSQILIADDKGENQRIITLKEDQGILGPHPDGGTHPVWSPDSKQIAFQRGFGLEWGLLKYDIFITSIDTSEGFQEVQITDNPYYNVPWDWCDSSIILSSEYSPDHSFDTYIDCYEYYLSNHTRRSIINCDSTFIGTFYRYSERANKFAFIGKTNEYTFNIYLMNYDGSDVTNITNNDIVITNLSWSPDGSKIVFIAGSYFHGGYMYVINRDGTNMHQIAGGQGNYYDSEWRPQK